MQLTRYTADKALKEVYEAGPGPRAGRRCDRLPGVMEKRLPAGEGRP